MLSEFGVHADAIAGQVQVSSPEDIRIAGEIIEMLRSIEGTFGTAGHQVNTFVLLLAEVPNASEHLTTKARRAAAVTKRIVDALETQKSSQRVFAEFWRSDRPRNISRGQSRLAFLAVTTQPGMHRLARHPSRSGPRARSETTRRRRQEDPHRADEDAPGQVVQ